MLELLQRLSLAFIPLFVAIDPIGLAAIFISMSRGASLERRRKIALQASVTGGAVALFFVFLGSTVFRLLSITVKDFQIAGGLILFILAARDIIQSTSEDNEKLPEDFGVVPLGMPLIAGPATIATLLILVQTQGLLVTLLALGLNLLLVLLSFFFCELLARPTGGTGLRAISKIISLLLAAIAINMIRQDI